MGPGAVTGDRRGTVPGDPGDRLRELARNELAARLPQHLGRLAWTPSQDGSRPAGSHLPGPAGPRRTS